MPSAEGPSGQDLEALATLWRERGVSITALGEPGSHSLAASDRALTSGLTESAGRIKLEPVIEAALAVEPFEIGEILGRGGMGVVHKAVQRSLRREVAIKRLPPGPPGRDDQGALSSLLKEAWVGGNLEHPNVVPVHSLVEIDGAPAVVMKQIEGTSLHAALRDPARVPELERGDLTAFQLRVLIAVCNAVGYAHRRGVLHLDIKPDNIMLGHFGEVFLLDWGLAAGHGDRAPSWLPSASDTRSISGTPDYMAPEVAMADGPRITPRTDVYLLGATLHEMVTGAPPHGAGTLLERLHDAYRSTPAVYGPSVPAELAAILHRSMHRDPDQRFPDAESLRDALESFLAHRRGDALMREARARIERLDAALAEGADEVSVSKLFGAARFALREAEGARPDHPDAAPLRAQVFSSMARRAMDGGRLELAAKYLDELGDAPALRARLDDLREEAQARAVRVERLEHLARDEDLQLGSRSRRRVTVGWALVLLLGNVVYDVLERRHLLSMDYRTMMLHSLGALVPVGLYTFVRRRSLFRNHANSSVYAVAIITFFLLQSFWAGASVLAIPFRSALCLSGIFYMLAGGAVSVLISPRFAWSPVAGALGLLGAALRPDLVWWMLGLGAGSALAIVGLSWRGADDDEVTA